MFSFPSSKQSANNTDDSSKSVRGNVFMVILIMLFCICASIWTFSDISGVYLVKNGNMSSPITLSIVRKAAALEGDLRIQQGGTFSLVDSSYKDDKLLLVFNPKESNKRALERNITITIEGKIVDGKIEGFLTSTAAAQALPIVLERDGGSSLHVMIQSHMPRF